MLLEWLVVIAAYFIGSVPFAYLVPRAVAGIDVRQAGSRNVGADRGLDLGIGHELVVPLTRRHLGGGVHGEGDGGGEGVEHPPHHAAHEQDRQEHQGRVRRALYSTDPTRNPISGRCLRQCRSRSGAFPASTYSGSADSNTQQKARGGASKQPSDKVLPVEEFRTERWSVMDADVEFTGNPQASADLRRHLAGVLALGRSWGAQLAHPGNWAVAVEAALIIALWWVVRHARPSLRASATSRCIAAAWWMWDRSKHSISGLTS